MEIKSMFDAKNKDPDIGQDNFYSNVFIPALRGGFVGLFMGVFVKKASQVLYPAPKVFNFQFFVYYAVILLIPLVWIIFLENREKAFVRYKALKMIVNPYLALLSMTYFMAYFS